MERNDLPIVCLPTELSGEDAARLIDFLYEIAEDLERLYLGELRLRRPLTPLADRPDSQPTDPPFPSSPLSRPRHSRSTSLSSKPRRTPRNTRVYATINRCGAVA
jgi:hypothetical protein